MKLWSIRTQAPPGGKISFTWRVPSPLRKSGETEYFYQLNNNGSLGTKTCETEEITSIEAGIWEVCTQSSVKSNSMDTDFNGMWRSYKSLHPSFGEWVYHYGDKSPQDGDWRRRMSLWGFPCPLETAFALFPSILSNIPWHLKKWRKLIIARIHYPSQCSGTDPACVCRCKGAMKHSFEWKAEQLLQGEDTHQALHVTYLFSSQCSESTRACIARPSVPCLRDAHSFTALPHHLCGSRGHSHWSSCC